MKLKGILAVLAAALAALGVRAQTVSTIVTNGLIEPNSVVVDANNLYYLSSSASNQVVKYDPGTGLLTTLAGVASGLAGTNDSVGFLAQFNSPKGLVLARGGLVVADSGNHTLRFITLTNSIAQVTTLAGTPGGAGLADGPAASALFNVPVGLAVDAAGNIYIADSKNNAIRKLDAGNNVSTVVTNGSGLFGPAAVALDNTGLLYIADTRNSVIRTFNPGTGTLALLAGILGNSGTNDNYFATQAQFNSPNGLIWVGGNIGLLVSDSGNNTLRQVYYNTPITNYSVATYAGIPRSPGAADGALLSAQFNFPIGLATDTIGGLLVIDSGNNRLRRIQTTPPETPVSNPEIGYVTFVTNSTTGSLVSQLVAVSNGIFFNDVTIAVLADTTAQTLFTSGATPGLFSTNTIPTPNPNLGIGTAPPPYSDGSAASAVPPTMVGAQPDLTIQAISTSSGRLPSAIVSARFQFKCGAPIILGDNPASFILSNITTGAQMWYTLDGSAPTNASPSIGPFFSGDTINLTLTSDVTFSVRAFKNNYQTSDLATKTLSPTNFLANEISFGFANGEASSDFLGAAGQTFVAPVTLTLLSGAQIFSLQFNLTVANLNGSPPVSNGSVGFESMLLRPVAGQVGTVYVPILPEMFIGGGFTNLTFTNTVGPMFTNLLGVGWLERVGATNLYDSTKQDLVSFSQAHDTLFQSKNGQVIVGGYLFQIPTTATTTNTYQIQIGRPSATSDGVAQDVFIQVPTNGSLAAGAINSIKQVGVGSPHYLVGDVAPFRWFNAGDFGETNLLNNDVLQVFQSAVYGADTPPTNSDFFDAMDSSNGSTNAANGNDTNINNIAYGDGKLLVDDVFVTFRRSLDPNLTWYVRYWSNGVRLSTNSIYFGITNVARNGGADLPAEQFSASLDDAPAATASSEPSTVAFSADDFRATPGQTVRLPIRAQVNGPLPLRVMMVNLNVEPLDGSPPLSTPAQFNLINALGPPTLTQSRNIANESAAWLDNTVSGLAGSNVIGTVQFTVPTNATPDSAYRIQFEHASASPNGLWIFPQQIQHGLVTLSDRSGSSLGDGIPDAWRLRYFGSAVSPSSLANLDADGDGMSNDAEFLAGTDPTDANSSLKFASVENNSSQGVTIRWASVAGKGYVVETSTAGTGGWTALSGNLAGTGGTMSFTDSAQSSVARFYRVRLGP